ncbi:MAG: motility associated factor glycosyltransferase family protein [Candidatus Omnitrophica bacterium]|nr:motility associated factor glycosyltransferase family protein [Candidatus Omnitrophota bacterium]
MQNLLDANLKLLEAYDRGMAERLRFHIPAGHVEVFATPQKYATLRIQKDNEIHLIHSGQDPIREAERWVQTVEIDSPYNLMVLGCGLFYHVYQLVKRHQSTLRRLIVIEQDLDVVYHLFSTINLSNFLRTKNTFFLVNPTSADVRSFMNHHLTPFTLDGLSIVEHSASCRLHPDRYRDIRHWVQESLQGGEMLLRTKTTLGGLIQENIIRNSPHLFNQPPVSALKDMFSGAPGFVIGAGPSLDRNIEQLAKVGEKGVIIASDTVLKPLGKHGIQPHIVVTTDPTDLNAAHFNGMEDLGETILAFSPSVNYRIPQKLNGAKAIIPLKTSRFLGLFSSVRNERHPLSTGVNVGQTCFNLARYMGCSPIVLAGLDFSFPVEGGHTHAAGTALQRKIYATNSPNAMKVELLDKERSLEEFEPIYVPGNTVERVATNKFWLNYLRSMEQEISRTNSNVYNCTEGGARIEGAEVAPLTDVIDSVCQNDVQARSNLQSRLGFYFGEPAAEGIAILKESIKILQTAVHFAEEGLRETSVLEKVANSLSPNPSLIREKLDAIQKRHEDLVQNQKVYAVLDEAADSVLNFFLRQDCRPSGDLTSPEYIKTALDRYKPYFEGMKQLCERFTIILHETLETMQSNDFDPSSPLF